MDKMNDMEIVDPEKAQRMIKQIIALEKRNIQSNQYSDKDCIDKIKRIIRDEAGSYAN